MTYYEMPATFDLEATTITDVAIDGKVEGAEGFMYVWQFALEGTVCMGRTWEEFCFFFRQLEKNICYSANGYRVLVIYSHFLSYEFQFVRSFLNITSIFAKEKRKVLKFNTANFEWRCSYFLSNMSLEKFCENSKLCKHFKMEGENFNYTIVRTCKTDLTDQEKQYCVNDVLGLEECILSLLEEDNLATIPLTSTGYVRRDCKKAVLSNSKNRSNFIRNSLDLEQYKFLKRIFRGGDTHASRFYTDVHLYNVKCKDIQSSYPAWMLLMKYPMGKLTRFKKSENISEYCKKYCCFMKIAFWDIEVYPTEPQTYIDIAHVDHYNGIVNDNGRVKKANYIEYYCTDIDLQIINDCYDYKTYKLLDGYFSLAGELPYELKQVIMSYYNRKCTLKNVDEKIYEYMKSKNKLNATFGMMVSALIHNDIILWEDEWKEFNVLKDITNEEILALEEAGIMYKTPEEKLYDFYYGYGGFLSYQWGIYITAWARLRLHQGIRACCIGNYNYAVYWDTDSVKHLSDDRIEQRFDEINKEVINAVLINTPPALSYVNEQPYYMGIWEREPDALEFKSYGSKKYCYYAYNKDGEKEFYITIAGMNKEKGKKAMLKAAGVTNPIDTQFILGKTFYDVGRTISYYNDDSTVRQKTINGVTFTTGSNIGVVNTTYTLGITNEYDMIINDEYTINIRKETENVRKNIS